MSKPSKTIKLVVKNGGTITGIYDDELVGLFVGAESVKIGRASHVEPASDGWYADMSPVGGPMLRGFTTRQQALDAEVQYLNRHIIN